MAASRAHVGGRFRPGLGEQAAFGGMAVIVVSACLDWQDDLFSDRELNVLVQSLRSVLSLRY